MSRETEASNPLNPTEMPPAGHYEIGSVPGPRVRRFTGRAVPRQTAGPGLIWTLIRTDFKVRYHGSLGGFVWALLKPVSMFLVLMGVFSFVFSSQPDYHLNLVLGLFLYDFFAEGTKTGLMSLYAKRHLLTKTRFPRWIVVATSASNAVIALLVFTTAILLYLFFAGRSPSPGGLVLFVFYQIQMFLMILGFSLATSVLYLRYRDLNHLWDAVSQAGFFVAPVVFPLDILPEALQSYVYFWPPTPVIVYSREVLIGGTVPALGANLLLLAGTLAILAVGILIFKRYARHAAEHV